MVLFRTINITARALSRVPPIQGLESYAGVLIRTPDRTLLLRSLYSSLHDGESVTAAGFFTVNASSNSNMYFWFFPAQVSSHFNKLL